MELIITLQHSFLYHSVILCFCNYNQFSFHFPSTVTTHFIIDKAISCNERDTRLYYRNTPYGCVTTGSHLNNAQKRIIVMRDHHLVTKPGITHLSFMHYVWQPTCNRIYMRSERAREWGGGGRGGRFISAMIQMLCKNCEAFHIFANYFHRVNGTFTPL